MDGLTLSCCNPDGRLPSTKRFLAIRLRIFLARMKHSRVFWALTWCSVLDGYQSVSEEHTAFIFRTEVRNSVTLSQPKATIDIFMTVKVSNFTQVPLKLS
jgi:hypothetical protein